MAEPERQLEPERHPAVFLLVVPVVGLPHGALQSGEQDAAKDLEEHNRLLGLMRKAYDDAGQSVDGFARNLSTVVRFQAEMNLQKMTADLAALARATVRSQTYVPAAAQGTLDGPLPPDVPMAVPATAIAPGSPARVADPVMARVARPVTVTAAMYPVVPNPTAAKRTAVRRRRVRSASVTPRPYGVP